MSCLDFKINFNLATNKVFVNNQLEYQAYRTQQAAIDPKYKSELCKKFITEGRCNYFFKCRFAHGVSDLLVKSRDVKSKAECPSFSKVGFCKYGTKCELTHSNKKDSTRFQDNITLTDLLHFTKKEGRLQVFNEIHKESSIIVCASEEGSDADTNSTIDDT